MDKWTSLIITEHQLVLCLVLNTIKLSVAITDKYLAEILHIITTAWFKSTPTRKGRQRFTAIESSRIVGKLAGLTEGAPWGPLHGISTLYFY